MSKPAREALCIDGEIFWRCARCKEMVPLSNYGKLRADGRPPWYCNPCHVAYENGRRSRRATGSRAKDALWDLNEYAGALLEFQEEAERRGIGFRTAAVEAFRAWMGSSPRRHEAHEDPRNDQQEAA